MDVEVTSPNVLFPKLLLSNLKSTSIQLYLQTQMRKIDLFKIKRQMKKLQTARGRTKTSMITLIIPRDSQISHVNKFLMEEYEAASRMKGKRSNLPLL